MSNKELTRSYTHSTNYSRIKKVQLVSVTYNILACKISILSCPVATSVYFDEKDFARTEVMHVEVEYYHFFSCPGNGILQVIVTNSFFQSCHLQSVKSSSWNVSLKKNRHWSLFKTISTSLFFLYEL